MYAERGSHRWIVILSTLALLVSACGEDRKRIQAPAAADLAPPASISNLAVSQIAPHSVALSWTAPGDDGGTGVADRYDLRYSAAAITAVSFATAIVAGGAPAPAVAGTAQTLLVTGLDSGTPYYFAIKTADEVPNWSGLSNVPAATTVSNAAPVVDSLSANSSAAAPGDTLRILCLAHDADADSMDYAWWAAAGTIQGTGPQAIWTAPAAEGLCRISVTATDRWGATDAETLMVAADGMSGTLLVKTRDGLVATDASRRRFVLHPSGGDVEVLGNRIFLAGSGRITEIDHQGQELTQVSSNPQVSGYVTLLPDLGFATITNHTDLIYLANPSGALNDTIEIPNPASELQNICGVVVGGRLIVSENGNNELFSVDLTTHETSVFRSVTDGRGWLGAIDYHESTFYLCRSRLVQAFTEGGELHDLCTLPAGNLTGIATAGRFAYVVVNFEGTLYRIDRTTGEYQLALRGLSYPADLEYVPVRLAQP